MGFKNLNETFFDTIRVEAKKPNIIKIAEEKEINFYYPDENTISISVNDTTNLNDLKYIIEVFRLYSKSD